MVKLYHRTYLQSTSVDSFDFKTEILKLYWLYDTFNVASKDDDHVGMKERHMLYKGENNVLNEKLNPMLDSLESCNIKSMDICFENNRIEMKVQSLNSNDNNYHVAFEDIKAFFYIDDTIGCYNHVQVEEDPAQGIYHYTEGIGEFASVKNVEAGPDNNIIDVARPNFSISMNGSSIFIEAPTLQINEDTFTFRTSIA